MTDALAAVEAVRSSVQSVKKSVKKKAEQADGHACERIPAYLFDLPLTMSEADLDSLATALGIPREAIVPWPAAGATFWLYRPGRFGDGIHRVMVASDWEAFERKVQAHSVRVFASACIQRAATARVEKHSLHPHQTPSPSPSPFPCAHTTPPSHILCFGLMPRSDAPQDETRVPYRDYVFKVHLMEDKLLAWCDAGAGAEWTPDLCIYDHSCVAWQG